MASGCLSPAQLAALASRYWPPHEVPTAVAVALAESGGCPDAHNTRGEDSRGLWQINVAPGANTQFATWNLFDPETNARAAYEVWRRWQGWGAWTAYTTGAYRRYLAGAPVPPAVTSSTTTRRLTPQAVRYLTLAALGVAALIALGCQPYAARALAGVNALRQGQGLEAVSEDAQLEALAYQRAAALAGAGQLDGHAGFWTLPWPDRCAYRGEIIGWSAALGDDNPTWMVELWRRSPTHAAVIAVERFRAAGAGAVAGANGTYYAVEFCGD